MKTAFIISGFNMNQTAADPKFAKLREAIKAKGYTVIAVPIQWNRKTISQYTQEFVDFYLKNKSRGENVVIGNSFGAVVAFLAAPAIKPNKTLVCSLSAYFKEDMPNQKRSYMLRRFGKQRTDDSHSISADDTATKINEARLNMVFLRGEKENWGRFIKLSERVKKSAVAVNGSKHVIVPDCPHSFRDPAYIKGIVAEL
jgi:alpha/beta superfamily hydrolase